MGEVLEFLTANSPFYLATVEDGQPRVRPMGFVMEFEDKLFFGAGDQKPVYRQMRAVPWVEICATDSRVPACPWLRLTGRAVFDERPEVWDAALKAMPRLADFYPVSGTARLGAFYLAEASAVFSDMKGSTRRLKL